MESSVGTHVYGVMRPANQAMVHWEKIHENRREFQVEGKMLETVLKIKKSLGLEIFGVDFILHKESREFYVIDINIFPGFIGVSNAAEKWWAYLERTFEI